MTENIQHYNLTFHLYDSLGEKPVQHERIEIRRRYDLPADTDEDCTLTTHVVTKRTNADGYLLVRLPSTEIKDTELVVIPYLLTVGNKPEIAFTLTQDIDYNDLLTERIEGGSFAVPLSTRNKLERDLSNPSADSTQIDYFRNYLKAIAATEVAEWAKTFNTTTFLPVSQIPILGTGKIADKAITLAKFAKGTPGRFVGFDLSGNATELTPPTADGEPVPVQAGSSTFVGLSDTPSAFTSNAGRFVKVNAGEDAVEFGSILADNIPDLDASKVTSGTFDVARLPDLAASKITSGTFDWARIPTLSTNKITSGTFDAARIPDLAASKITSGTFDAARIPDLAASKITSGVFAQGRIPNLSANKITSGTFNAARLPDLAASKITSGEFADARIPDLNTSKITNGTLADARIPDLTASKITSGTLHLDRIPNLDTGRIPNLDTGKITSGTFDAARIPDIAASKITSGSFADARIPDLTASKITSGTFDSVRIPDLDADKIVSGQFGSARIAGFSIINSKLAPNAVSNSKLSSNSITTSKIVNNSVTLAKIAPGTAGKVIGFNASGDPVELNQTSGGASSFTGLSDTPAAYVTSKFIKSNAAGNALEFVSLVTADIPDNAITLAKLAPGTAGKFIGYDASGDPVELDAPSGQVGISVEDYVHLGTGDLTGTDTGVVTGSEDLTTDGVEVAVRFDETLAGVNVPTTGSYDNTTGEIVLPTGTWVVCASANFDVTIDGASVDREAVKLAIEYDGNIRHANSSYLRNLNNVVAGFTEDSGFISVTGAVISDGIAATKIITSVIHQSNPDTNNPVSISGAHVHAVRQVVGAQGIQGLPGPPGGVTTFIGLTDTPNAITASQYVRGNGAGSSLVFGTIPAADIPNLNASKINAGTFVISRIPNLSTSKITSGTFDGARIPNLDANKITSGTFDVARLPDIAASKITSGTFDAARLASGGTDDQVLTRTASGVAWEDAPDSGIDGGTEITVMDEITLSDYNALSNKVSTTLYVING